MRCMVPYLAGHVNKNMHYTHIQNLSLLYGLVLELMTTVNSPQVHAALLKEAGVSIDRALRQLLVRISMEGPIGVGELGVRVGRDHTTVSRQAAKLEQLGFVKRVANKRDRRISTLSITADGRDMVETLEAARARMFSSLLEPWSEQDQKELIRLMSRLVGDTKERLDVLMKPEECDAG